MRWRRRLRAPILGLAFLSVWLAVPAVGSAVTLTGPASTYGNDPALGWVDHGDNNLPALAGATNDRPGIAVMHYDTLGHWWRVCAPVEIVGSPNARARCRWVRQTDIGPVTWVGRAVDINAVASRVLWRIPASRFPTDIGSWRLRSHGRELHGVALAQARYQRCQSRRCRAKWKRRVHAARRVAHGPRAKAHR